MKCKLRVPKEVVESIAPQALIDQCERHGGRLIAPAGAIIDDTECWRIVMMGQAVPADEECELATQRTPEQVAQAEYAADRLAKGIHPDDFARYDRGELIGYNADGTDILSPEALAKLESEEDE